MKRQRHPPRHRKRSALNRMPMSMLLLLVATTHPWLCGGWSILVPLNYGATNRNVRDQMGLGGDDATAKDFFRRNHPPKRKRNLQTFLEATNNNNAGDDYNYESDDHTPSGSSQPHSQSQELQQKMAELLQAEMTNNDEASIGRQQLPQIPDLTAFQKQVDRNAAGYKTPSAFAETSTPFSDLSNSNLDSDDEWGELSLVEGAAESRNNPLSKQPATPAPNRDAVTDATTTPFASASPSSSPSTPIDGEEDDGFFLAPDMYERSRDLLNVDGSLDLGPEQSPEEMKAILEGLLAATSESSTQVLELEGYNIGSTANIDDEEDWDQVWAAIQKEKAKPFNAKQSEDLHKQVFENEQGFLEQSQSFRKGLTDPQIAREATAERRSAKYRQRQAKAQDQLERNMNEFEKVLLERQRPGARTCSRCQCRLSDRDYDIAPQLWMKQRNLTSLCESCYINLLDTSRNMQKRLPGKVATRTTSRPTSASSIASNSQASSTRPTSDLPTPSKPNADVTQAGNDDQTEEDFLEENSEASSSWEEVVDPDTGEIFYWNEETDEVRWEI